MRASSNAAARSVTAEIYRDMLVYLSVAHTEVLGIKAK